MQLFSVLYFWNQHKIFRLLICTCAEFCPNKYMLTLLLNLKILTHLEVGVIKMSKSLHPYGHVLDHGLVNCLDPETLL